MRSVTTGKYSVKKEKRHWNNDPKIAETAKGRNQILRSLLNLEGTTRINAELAEALIESMYLYGDGRLEINFRFKGAIEHE